MSILEIFEKVNLVIPIEQQRFFHYFEDSVDELQTLYDGFVFEKGTEWEPPKDLSDANTVRLLYHNAIADNIVFLSGGGDSYKSEFIRKSNEAFLKYWNDNAKGKKVKRQEW